MRRKIYHLCKSVFGGCESVLSYPEKDITNKKNAKAALIRLQTKNDNPRIIFWIGWNWK